MHDTVGFAAQHVPRKMGREGLPHDRSRKHSARLALLWNWRFRLRFHIFNIHFLWHVLHESFALTSSSFTSIGKPWMKALVSHTQLSVFARCLARSSAFTSSTWMSRTKPSFSQLQLSLFEGCLEWKLRFHIFNSQFLKDVSHDSFVVTTSSFSLL